MHPIVPIAVILILVPLVSLAVAELLWRMVEHPSLSLASRIGARKYEPLSIAATEPAT
jgi:hypothetical protein